MLKRKNERNMDKSEKRNLWGSVVCFLLSALFGCFGLALMMCREVQQANENNTDIEVDDIERYSFMGCLGYIANVTLLILLF